jgi:DNA-binding SARP family transcriptional activator
MQFRILGPLEVLDGESVVPRAGGKLRALLAVLLLSANEVVSSDRLLEALCGEHPPESGAKALQVRVSQLRKALGPGGSVVLTRAPGYLLALEGEQLDLSRFERLVAEADQADPPLAAVKLREALALWRGPPLGDLAYESFAQPAIGRLEELRLGALEKRIEADLALGRHAELVGELEELTGLCRSPTRCTAWLVAVATG